MSDQENQKNLQILVLLFQARITALSKSKRPKSKNDSKGYLHLTLLMAQTVYASFILLVYIHVHCACIGHSHLWSKCTPWTYFTSSKQHNNMLAYNQKHMQVCHSKKLHSSFDESFMTQFMKVVSIQLNHAYTLFQCKQCTLKEMYRIYQWY